MSDNTPNGEPSPHKLAELCPEADSEQVEAETATDDSLIEVVLPDPSPAGTNPFLVISWILFTGYVAARNLTYARERKVEALGRKMRTENREGLLVLHEEDDVDWRGVRRALDDRIGFSWTTACSDARRLCAAFPIPFATYDSLLKEAVEKLDDLYAVIRGVADDKELYPFGPIEGRLSELADSTTPKLPQVSGGGLQIAAPSSTSSLPTTNEKSEGAEAPGTDQRFPQYGHAGVLIGLGQEVFCAIADRAHCLQEDDVHALNNRMSDAIERAMRVIPTTVDFREWERRVLQVRSACADLLRRRVRDPELLEALSDALSGLQNAAISQDAAAHSPGGAKKSEKVNHDDTDSPEVTENDKTKRAPFVFAKSGNLYFIRAYGAEGFFTARKGFHDLYHLLRDAGRPVPLRVLDSKPADRSHMGDRNPALDAEPLGGMQTGTSQQPSYDRPGMAKIRESIERYRLEIAEAVDDAERNSSQEALDALLAQVKADTGLGGKPRDLNNNWDKLRPKIWGRIKSAIKELDEAKPSLRELAQHLEAHITTESGTVIYNPTPPIPTWVFSIA